MSVYFKTYSYVVVVKDYSNLFGLPLTDDPETFDNAPVGIQVMGKRLEEEQVLAAVGEITCCLQLAGH